jgi:PleD family two-component response regulator
VQIGPAISTARLCARARATRVAIALRVVVDAALVTAGPALADVPDDDGILDEAPGADAALYAAKREGRDRSVRSSRVAEPEEAPAHPSLRPGAGAA